MHIFDGCIDVTNILIEVENSAKLNPVKIKEHYDVVIEPGSKYLFYFTLENAPKEQKTCTTNGKKNFKKAKIKKSGRYVAGCWRRLYKCKY